MACREWAPYVEENLGVRSVYGVNRPVKWVRIDSNGKMETRNPVESFFGSEIPAICNHCRVVLAWRCKTLKMFAIFFRKTTSYGKISKLCFTRFHLVTDQHVVFKFRKIWLTVFLINFRHLTTLCCHNYAMITDRLKFPTKWYPYGMSGFHFYC